MKRILLMAGLMTMLGSVGVFAEESDIVNNKINQYVCNNTAGNVQVGVWSWNNNNGWKEIFNSIGNGTYVTETSTQATTNVVIEPTTQATTSVILEPTTQATTNVVVEPTTQATTNIVVEPTTQVTTNIVVEPTTETTTNKVVETTTEATTNSSYANQVLDLVNKERAKNGLSALSLSAEAGRVAQLKADDMAANGYFSHTSPTYGSPFDMLKQFGVSYKTAGENIAKGQTSPQAVMNAWMNSEGHKANILKNGYTKLGVGYTVKNGTTYWVQMFIG